jgi:hypothetical protein
MKHTLLGLSFFLVSLSAVHAQDEGTVVKRERIAIDKGIFVLAGPSFTTLKNDGDYSTGFNIEGGYQKRLNRVFSIGGSLSYLSFKYDPTFNQQLDPSGYPFNFFSDDDIVEPTGGEFGRLVELEGGKVSIISLALNLKLNFIPVKDDSKFSVYGFAKPFIASAKRADVTGLGEAFLYDGTNEEWVYQQGQDDPWSKDDGLEVLGEESKITGGIFIGTGIELFPAKKVSFFAQLSFGYTLPVNIISFSSYGTTISDDYLNPAFPMKDKGFASGNLGVGLSINLD